MASLLIPKILTTLLNYGFHPCLLKKSMGIILGKPEKADYSSPMSCRVIVLLHTFAKILKRVVAIRLNPIARSLSLVSPNQTGFLPLLST